MALLSKFLLRKNPNGASVIEGRFVYTIKNKPITAGYGRTGRPRNPQPAFYRMVWKGHKNRRIEEGEDEYEGYESESTNVRNPEDWRSEMDDYAK